MDESPPPLPDSASRTLVCPTCGRSFARREHLKRHCATHLPAGTGPFVCQICAKCFKRSDVLAHHEATHSLTQSGRKEKMFRSCSACVVAKARCSTGWPCSRCVAKRIDCCPQTTRTDRSEIQHHFSAGNRLSRMSPTDTQSIINTYYTPPSTARQHASEDEQVQSPSGVHSRHFGARMAEQLDVHLVDNSADPISDSAPLEVQDLDADSTLLRTETIPSLHAQGDLNTSATASQAKDLYLNGNGARLPKVRRAKATRKQSSTIHLPANQYGPFAFPVSRSTTPDLEDKSLQIRSFLMEGTWEDMLEKFQRYCLTPSALFPPFTSSAFPNRREFDVMISTHFDSFHQVLPIIHMPTLSLGRSNWILALGIATSGAHFVERNSKSELVAAMHEFLQRALIHEVNMSSLARR